VVICFFTLKRLSAKDIPTELESMYIEEPLQQYPGHSGITQRDLAGAPFPLKAAKSKWLVQIY
jgi:hypothetical protein